MLNHKKIDFKNRNTYQNKKLIKIIYNNYYKKIKKNIYISNNRKILELGSGGGNIKNVIKKSFLFHPQKQIIS
jgi:16S rRNA A1518/A1519 N6-dimethyltransferase RsmA/KsgA/DIM1 with predicted DNA glycosylase/AP lyase activity